MGFFVAINERIYSPVQHDIFLGGFFMLIEFTTIHFLKPLRNTLNTQWFWLVNNTHGFSFLSHVAMSENFNAIPQIQRFLIILPINIVVQLGCITGIHQHALFHPISLLVKALFVTDPKNCTPILRPYYWLISHYISWYCWIVCYLYIPILSPLRPHQLRWYTHHQRASINQTFD